MTLIVQLGIQKITLTPTGLPAHMPLDSFNAQPAGF